MPAALLLALIVPGIASAFPLTNCTLSLNSTAKGGGTLDTATGGAPDAARARNKGKMSAAPI